MESSQLPNVRKYSTCPLCLQNRFVVISIFHFLLEINLQGRHSVTVINAYAPTSSAEDEKVEQFYDDIERAMADEKASRAWEHLE